GGQSRLLARRLGRWGSPEGYGRGARVARALLGSPGFRAVCSCRSPLGGQRAKEGPLTSRRGWARTYGQAVAPEHPRIGERAHLAIRTELVAARLSQGALRAFALPRTLSRAAARAGDKGALLRATKAQQLVGIHGKPLT